MAVKSATRAAAKAGTVMRANSGSEAGRDTSQRNANHYDRLHMAIDKIKAHPVMEGVMDAPPIGRGGLDPLTGKSGYKDVFDPSTVAADMSAAGTSETAGNFFWQNSLLPPLPGVPFNQQAIEIFQDLGPIKFCMRDGLDLHPHDCTFPLMFRAVAKAPTCMHASLLRSATSRTPRRSLTSCA